MTNTMKKPVTARNCRNLILEGATLAVLISAGSVLMTSSGASAAGLGGASRAAAVNFTIDGAFGQSLVADDFGADAAGVTDCPVYDQSMEPVDTSANDEQDALAAYLDSVGIEHTMVTECDSHWVEYNWDNEAAVNAVDDYWWSLYPMAQDDIDSNNAQAESLVAYLNAHGVAATLTTDRHGLESAEYSWDDQAAIDAADDYYYSLYPMAQADIDSNNADAEALVAYLTGHGVTATLTTDRHGLESAEYSWDDEATSNAVDDYYWSLYPMAQADIDSNNADAEALVAYMADHGVTATLVTDRHGLESAEYDWNDQAANDAANDFYAARYPDMYSEMDAAAAE